MDEYGFAPELYGAPAAAPAPAAAVGVVGLGGTLTSASEAAQAESDRKEHLAHVRQQMTLLELSVACVVQSDRDFFSTQCATLLESLGRIYGSRSRRSPLCVLRLLRGCYHPPQPYWTAGANALATSGARLVTRSEAQSVHLGRYAVSMYPDEPARAQLQRLAHVQSVLFEGWAEPNDLMTFFVNKLSETPVGGLMRFAGIGNLTELPHATQLVEVLAEVVVCMASHAVQWAVEQVIMPFLKFRKRADASAAYAMVGRVLSR